jgi:hypothetical protein
MEPLGPPQAEPSSTTSRKALLLAFENAGYLTPALALLVDLAIFSGGVALVLASTPLWVKILGSMLVSACSSSAMTPATARSSKAGC